MAINKPPRLKSGVTRLIIRQYEHARFVQYNGTYLSQVGSGGSKYLTVKCDDGRTREFRAYRCEQEVVPTDATK
jgi:hypothetical protein